MKKGNVVVWHIGRCGSTVLSSMLNQHPDLQSLKEFMNPLMRAKLLGEEIPDLSTTFKGLENHDSSKIQIAELKFLKAQHLSVYNLSLIDLINKFIDVGYDRFVILERKNYLKRMISHCVGQHTQLYHLKKNETPKLQKINMNVESIKVGKDTHSLIDWLNIIKHDYNILRELLVNTDYMELKYEEDFLTDVIKAYKKVCLFLNVDSYEVDVPFARTNPFSISEMLINIKDVENTLKDTEFSWMLHE